MVEPQLEILENQSKVISMIKSSVNTSFAKAFALNPETQGALALAQKVANNPVLDLAKKSSVTAFRDFGIRKDVTTSQ